VTFDWAPLTAELALWRAQHRVLPLWWRDDDAIAPSEALDQLGTLSASLSLPVHLAVIPKYATPQLVELCSGPSPFVPLVHGWAHENRQTGAGKKAEFGAFRDDAITDLAAALARMTTLFGPRLLKMFVPPWNRISPDLIATLPTLGFDAVSTYKARANRSPVAGLVQINTHIDPIFWRGGGGFVEADALIAGIVKLLQDRRIGLTDNAEPLGFLTHHLVHNAAIWEFTNACLSTLLESGATAVNLRAIKEDLP
jgi:hypothetical protein